MAPGERLPDVRAPLSDGSLFVLSEDAGGLPVALVTGPQPPKPRPDLLVIHVTSTHNNGSTSDAATSDGLLTLIDDGQITQALTGNGTTPTAVIAGPDHRVLATGPASKIDRLATFLPRRGEPIRRTTSIPLLTVERVIDDELSRRLIDSAAAAGWQASPMSRAGDDGTATLRPDGAKAREDHLLGDDALAAEVTQCFSRRLLPEITRSLAHRITSHEQFKIVRYRSGSGWFEPHRDNTAASTRGRRLAVTINLEPGDGATYDGGDLRFPELGPDLWRPPIGAAIVFSCGLLHEVTPVTAGVRHALITFLA